MERIFPEIKRQPEAITRAFVDRLPGGQRFECRKVHVEAGGMSGGEKAGEKKRIVVQRLKNKNC